MPNFPIRFAQGQGLEVSAATQTQGGLLELRNASCAARDVIRKRSGYPPVTMEDQNGFTAADAHAVWYRDGDLAVEVDAQIPSLGKATGRLWSRTPTLPTAWRDVGPWSRYTLRDIGAYGYPSGEVVNCGASRHVVNNATTTWTVIERANGALADAAVLVRESDGIESEETIISGTAIEPIILYVSASRALIAYKNGTSIRYREVAPTLGAELTTTLTVSGGNAWFAAASLFSDNNPIYVFGVLTSANNLVLRFISAGFASFTHTQALAITAGTKRDVDIKIVNASGSTDSFFLYVGTAGGNDTEVFRFAVDMSISTASLTWQASTDHGGDEAMAIAVEPHSALQANAYVELSSGGIVIPSVQLRSYTSGGSSSLVATRIRSALLSATIGDVEDASGSFGSHSVWISMVSPSTRRGAVLWRGQTNEIIARAGVGNGEKFSERSTRKAHAVANEDGDGRIVFASRYTLQALDTVAKEAAVWTLQPAAANRPAVLDSIAVSAHGGFPRAYDGQQVYEHDWHDLPEYTAIAVAAAGFSAGEYGLAITWEWPDRTGQIYRSAPTFLNITLAASQTARVALNALDWTERAGVRAVLWRTLPNGTVYYRSQEVDGQSPPATVDYNVVDAVLVTQEPLDQVSGGVSFSEPARVTDFVAVAGARLWSRDPRRARLARFSQPRREGFAPHWPLIFGVEPNENFSITSIAEMDGRVILFGADIISYTQGDGPDVNGVGSYPSPASLPVEIGATDHASVALSPFGLYFASSEGVRLLARGLATANVSEAIDALYEIDSRNITGIVYRAASSELYVISSNGRQLTLHGITARWSSWGPDVGEYELISIAESDGEIAWLNSAGVVHVRDGEIYADDAVLTPYSLVVSTPWLRPYVQAAAHTLWNFQQMTVFGTYEGVHGLEVNLYFDDEVAARYALTKAEADVSTNNAAGLAYIYRAELGGVACYNARIEIKDVQTVANAAMRLEGLDVHYEPAGASGVQLETERLLTV